VRNLFQLCFVGFCSRLLRESRAPEGLHIEKGKCKLGGWCMDRNVLQNAFFHPAIFEHLPVFEKAGTIRTPFISHTLFAASFAPLRKFSICEGQIHRRNSFFNLTASDFHTFWTFTRPGDDPFLRPQTEPQGPAYRESHMVSAKGRQRRTDGTVRRDPSKLGMQASSIIILFLSTSGAYRGII
jgi:hypothetical protein